jgi:hypothetical protein
MAGCLFYSSLLFQKIKQTMKRIFFSIIAASALLLGGCIKNDQVVFQDSQIEFDAAAWNANAVGVTYPILTRIPALGVATSSSNGALLTRTTGTFNLRVNLVGAQKTSATTFSYKVASESTAIAGTHYAAFSGTGTIPANSSFATIPVTVLNPGPGAGSVVLVLELVTGNGLTAATNYAKVGLSIAQP